MKIFAVIFAGAFAFMPAFPALAATFGVGEEYFLGRGQSVFGDLYAFGGNVSVSGDVGDDIIAAGGNIIINGKISGNANVAGGNATMLGNIGGDARVSAGQIIIGGNVAGDVVAAGGTVHVLSGANVAGDVVAAGGAVSIDGDVAGSVFARGGKISINGNINGDVVSKYSDKVEVGNGASIGGDFSYTSSEEADISAGARIFGEVTFNRSSVGKNSYAAKALAGLFFVKLVSLIFAVILLSVFFGKFSEISALGALRTFGFSLAIGAASIVAVPLISIILLFSAFGTAVGMFLGTIFLALMIFARIFAGIVFGALLSKWLVKEARVNWRWSVFGITALSAVEFVPFAGWAVSAILTLSALGYLVKALYERVWISR